MSALLTFLGGSAFRMLWGEISAAWTKHQDHKHELALLEAQAKVDAQRHAQTLELQKLTHEQGLQVVHAQSEAKVDEIEANAWLERVASLDKKVGIDWIDGWRACIQPALATIAILLWVAALNEAGYKLSEWDKELVAAILGMYVANRHLQARGK